MTGTYITNTPGSVALVVSGRNLVRLAFNTFMTELAQNNLGKELGERHTEIHNVVPADGAVVDDDI